MDADWAEMELGELIELKRGYDLPKNNRNDGDIPIISSSGESGLHDIYKVRAPGVVTGRYGTIGAVFFAEKDFWPLNTTLYVKDFKGNNPLFVYYFLKTISYSDYSDKAAVPGVNRNHLHKALIKVPRNVEYQKLLAEILRGFDLKITLNIQINQTLEAIAQAIFKSWFVDFEPVKAKMAVLEAGGTAEEAERAAMRAISGKDEVALTQMQAEQQDAHAELAQTAALFPSSMQDSELGEIPEGWNVTNLGSVAQCFDKNRIPLSKGQREQRKGTIPYYGATSAMDYVDKAIFNGIYLLVGEDGSVLKEDGTPFIQYIWGQSWVNNHAHVLQGQNGVCTEQLMLFISLQNITAYVTGAVQLKLNQKNMNSIPFIKATNELNSKFESVIKPLYSSYRSTTEQNRILETARDSLLPRLLSGELIVGAIHD